MLNFHDLCQKLDETIEANPTYGHSNKPRNPRVIDQGAHLDKQLLDKTRGVSTRRDDADYSEEPEISRNAAEELSRLPGVEGDTARLIHKAVINNPRFKTGISLPLAQFISALRKQVINDDGMEKTLANTDANTLLKSLHILSRTTSAPILDVTKGSDGKYAVSVKQYKADPALVRQQAIKKNTGDQAQQIVTNSQEDQLAKPGEGNRYRSIQANAAPAKPGQIPQEVIDTIQNSKMAFNKAHDVAMHSGTGTSMDQAAKAYMAILQQHLQDPYFPSEAKTKIAKEAQRVQGMWQQFVSQWGQQHINPQSGV